MEASRPVSSTPIVSTAFAAPRVIALPGVVRPGRVPSVPLPVQDHSTAANRPGSLGPLADVAAHCAAVLDRLIMYSCCCRTSRIE